ncbi:unnamed protein product, partial [Rotaria socialis]
MSSSTDDLNKKRTEDNISYRPGTFRYHDVPPNERRKLFDDRQNELNPCLKESEISNACLMMSGDDYSRCHAQVENYKTCKRFWTAVRNFATVNHLLRNDGFPPLYERPIWKKQLHT